MKAAVVGLAFASMTLLVGYSYADQKKSAGANTPDTVKIPAYIAGSQTGLVRTDEEILSVFDRNRTHLYKVYQRYLKEQPALQGKVILRVTIEPSGAVSACGVESTDIPSAAFLADIVDRIKQLDFGAKDNVPNTAILYPIDFRIYSKQ